MVGKRGRVAGAFVSVALVWQLSDTAGALASGTVVTNCSNDNQLSAAITAGGSITFNCGVATIVISSTNVVTKNVTIDGGAKITLSGAGARQLFSVAVGGSLDLKHIVLKKGHVSGNGGAVENDGFLAL